MFRNKREIGIYYITMHVQTEMSRHFKISQYINDVRDVIDGIINPSDFATVLF